ncbi:ABC transporter permease [Furfurilactobacillus cerevisiae]|uniref:ABC transporter permease n=1 Tax=Furfurilactobacillus rossiae TaxID=231049 RepID=UPI003B983862
MWTLYKQESFKLLKKKSTLWISIVLALIVFGFALTSRLQPKYFSASGLFTTNFASTTFIMFFLIAAAASIVTMEFQYGTIKTVVSQRYSRSMILVSKWLVILTYSLYLYVMTAVLSLIAKLVFVNDKFSLTGTGYNNDIWQDWLANLGAGLLTLWLLISLVFLLATLFKSSAVAISVGILGYFVLNIVSSVMFILIHSHEWLKWNPINFLNYGSQVLEPSLSKLTRLSDVQLFWGNVGYIALFLCIGLLLFRKRNV